VQTSPGHAWLTHGDTIYLWGGGQSDRGVCRILSLHALHAHHRRWLVPATLTASAPTARRGINHHTRFPTTLITTMTGAMAKDPSSWDSLYVCLVFSIALIILRLGLRCFRRQSFTRGDYWCMTAAVFTLARLVANHFLLVYGSTRSTPTFSECLLKRTILTPM
jgi:hypothetical protein